MADRPSVKTRPITRDKLASFLKSQELIKAFENLSKDVAETIPDAIASSSADASSVIAQDVFSPRAPQPQAPSDTAGAILAGQIFGA